MLLDYVRRYYLLRFLYVLAISFTKTTFYLYLYSSHHLAHEQILFIFAVFNISAMLLEIPTSAIGEWFGPRSCFLAGMFLKVIAALIFFFGSNVWHFCVAEVLSAFAISLISGTLQAWMMNQLNLHQENDAPHVAQIFMVGRRISTTGLAIGGAIGALLGSHHLGYPWLLVAIGSAATFFLAYALLNESFYQPWQRKKKIHDKWQCNTLLEGYRLAASNKILLVVIWESFLVSFALASPQIWWIPSLKSYFGKDMWFIANMWLCIAGIQFVGTFGLKYLLRHIPSMLLLKMIITITCVAFFCCLLVPNIYCFIVFYLLLEWLGPYQQTLNLTLIQQNTCDHGRITILSLESLADKFGNTLGLITAGALSISLDIFGIWAIGACLYATIIPCYFYLILQKWVPHNRQLLAENR